MSKFTGGQWCYSKTGGTVLIDGKGIAKVYEAASLLPDYTEEGAANARLIASAPEMYSKLLDCAEFLEERGMLGCDGCSEFAAELLVSVESLIARIEEASHE